MNVLVVMYSESCFHCVDVDQFPGIRQLAGRCNSLIGTSCPLCGVIIAHGDLKVIVDGEQLGQVRDGAVLWDTHEPPRGFEGFFPLGNVEPRSSSEIANMLRRQLEGPPSEERRKRCEAGTRVLVANAIASGREAEGNGDVDRARRAYRAAVDYGGNIEFAAAALQLGQIEEEHGEVLAAVGLYRKATETNDHTLKATAWLCLGGALDQVGDAAGARRALRDCVSCGESIAQAEAAYRLGSMIRQEDQAGAGELFELVLRCDDSTWSAGAALRLGLICAVEGRRTEAKERWAYAVSNGDDRERAAAAFNLGWAFEEEGTIRRAKAFYRIAIDSPELEVVRLALERLEELGRRQSGS
jgi:tetratricopeptide (TPR) repeat protein